jgi:hypothetical protein
MRTFLPTSLRRTVLAMEISGDDLVCMTLRWRELDSNLWFRAGIEFGSRLRSRSSRDAMPRPGLALVYFNVETSPDEPFALACLTA